LRLFGWQRYIKNTTEIRRIFTNFNAVYHDVPTLFIGLKIFLWKILKLNLNLILLESVVLQD
jgi:hypothetical protein